MTIFAFIDRELPGIGEISTAGYFLGLRIRGSSPLMAFHTYPQAWIDEYTENGYVLRDPLTTWAMTIGGTVRWRSLLLPDPFGVFRKAARHGLKHGASIAHGPVGSLTICSIARSDRDFTDDEIGAVKDIVVRLHDRVALPKTLTDRQRVVLSDLADGTSVTETADKLGVAVSDAAGLVRDLCQALVARSPEEAVQRARDYRLL